MSFDILIDGTIHLKKLLVHGYHQGTYHVQVSPPKLFIIT